MCSVSGLCDLYGLREELVIVQSVVPMLGLMLVWCMLYYSYLVREFKLKRDPSVCTRVFFAST